MSQRKDWKRFGAKEYLCPICKRDKGMLYLFPDKTIRYICFCGRNITIDWIKKRYNFNKKTFSKTPPLREAKHNSSFKK